jgi:ABC-2 type transport system permease protein
MNILLYIVWKEFLQIARDKFMSKVIILMPLLQMVILVYAATFEIKNINLLVVDRDGSSASTRLINKFEASDFFVIDKQYLSDLQIDQSLSKGGNDLVMVIPSGFEKDFQNNKTASMQLLIDAVNGSAAELTLAYCRATIASFNKEILVEEFGIIEPSQQNIAYSSRFWYNPLLNYKVYMAPGILVILVTVIAWFLTGMNLVREKENGTMEQLNVTPIRKYQFIAGKLIPFLIIGLVDLAFGLLLAKLLYHVPFEGSLFTLFVFAVVYLIAVLGIGLFISTISNTQQQVLFVSFFFVMIFVLMSGLFTPLENMPQWGQVLNWINPLAYFSRVIRMVLLKGSSIIDIGRDILIMLVYGLIINALAIWRYKKIA